MTEKMLTYALGRGLEYYDMPAVRAIVSGRGPRRLPVFVARARRRQQRAVSDETAQGSGLRASARPTSARRSLTVGTELNQEIQDMFITKMSLPRRTFLRGMGVTVALPLLDAMVPALTAHRQTAANPVRRFGAVYVPHGKILDQWTPATRWRRLRVHADPEAARSASAITCASSAGSMVRRIRQPAATRPRPAMWLTGISPKKTEGVDVRNDTTIDQLIAKADRPGDAVPVARTGDRRLHRLRRRLRRRATAAPT